MNQKIKKIKKIFNLTQHFVGWGRKPSGFRAIELAKKNNTSFLLLEDGFIRSVGLGDEESCSIVKDDIGIYYDATTPSRLEELLKTYDFKNDSNLLQTATKAIKLIKEKKISKYNTGSLKLPSYLQTTTKKVLIIAQTKGDMSLVYGLANQNPKTMIQEAIEANKEYDIYLKIHPDVLAGKKASSIDIEYAKKHCHIITEDIHPIVLLEAFEKVYTQTSQMGFEALLLGKEVHLFGLPFYAGWEYSDAKVIIHDLTPQKEKILQRRKRKLSLVEVFAAAYILYSEYYNPFLQNSSSLLEIINTIDHFRNLRAKNDGKLFFFGFSFWKQKQTKKFFMPLKTNEIFFCKTLDEALTKGLDKDSKVYIWGKKAFDEVLLYTSTHNIQLYRVEDGFIRSVTLGSDLTKAYSLVVDSNGIYFDPTSPSDLEDILEHYAFDEEILKRANFIKNYLVEKKLSKYNIHKDKQLTFSTSKKIVLVVGQVEDDASIIYGGNGMSNLELLQEVAKRRKDSYIIYKPHPDVLAGNRKGNIDKEVVLQYANEQIDDISLPSLLEVCDELHTITSLSGFEALLRGKEVFTYGMPFYAGWGLTNDVKKCQRRTKQRTLLELVAATYIIYPRYVDPKSGALCEAEVVINAIEQLKQRYKNDTFYRFFTNVRNFFSRKIQLCIKVCLGL